MLFRSAGAYYPRREKIAFTPLRELDITHKSDRVITSGELGRSGSS
jgi:hypothetical protein